MHADNILEQFTDVNKKKPLITPYYDKCLFDNSRVGTYQKGTNLFTKIIQMYKILESDWLSIVCLLSPIGTSVFFSVFFFIFIGRLFLIFK